MQFAIPERFRRDPTFIHDKRIGLLCLAYAMEGKLHVPDETAASLLVKARAITGHTYNHGQHEEAYADIVSVLNERIGW